MKYITFLIITFIIMAAIIFWVITVNAQTPTPTQAPVVTDSFETQLLNKIFDSKNVWLTVLTMIFLLDRKYDFLKKFLRKDKLEDTVNEIDKRLIKLEERCENLHSKEENKST